VRCELHRDEHIRCVDIGHKFLADLVQSAVACPAYWVTHPGFYSIHCQRQLRMARSVVNVTCVLLPILGLLAVQWLPLDPHNCHCVKDTRCVRRLLVR
jgi:hypothetical protein